MLEELVGTRTNKRPFGYFEVVIQHFSRSQSSILMRIVFPGSFQCPGFEYAIFLLWQSLLRSQYKKPMFNMTRRALCSLRVIWGVGGASWSPTNKRPFEYFQVVNQTFLELPKFNFDKNIFSRIFSMSRIQICYPFALAITFEGRKLEFNIRHSRSKVSFRRKPD